VAPLADGNFVFFTIDDITQGILLQFSPGDGTLGAAPLYAVGKQLSSIAVADLNGDQVQDVIVYDGDSGAVQVMLNGPAGFQSPKAYSIPGGRQLFTYPQAMAVGDLNNDGKTDIVAAGLGSTPFGSSTPGTVSVFLGKGDGTLVDARASIAGSHPVAVVLDDLNGDHKLDAAVANYGDHTSSTDRGGVSVLIGNGDGSLKAPVNYPQGSLRPISLATADVNGDGKPDLVVANASDTNNMIGAGNISVLLNSGDGTFRAGFTSQVGSPPQAPTAIAVKDLNGDGKPDLAVVFTGIPDSNGITTDGGGIAIFLGNGDGTFRTGPVVNALSGNITDAITISDVNGDGKPDLVVTHCCFADVIYLLGNGDGSFQTEQHILSGPSPVAAAVADFNRDGQPDLTFADRDGYVVALVNAFPTIGVSPSTVVLSESQTQQFGSRSFFNNNTPVTWSISPSVGAISPDGIYTAPDAIDTPQIVTVFAVTGFGLNNVGSAVITLKPSTQDQF
jgi:hypothetical protein